jgi:hypothetical protein
VVRSKLPSDLRYAPQYQTPTNYIRLYLNGGSWQFYRERRSQCFEIMIAQLACHFQVPKGI